MRDTRDVAAGAELVADAAQLVADSCVKIDVTFEGPEHRGLAAVSLVSGLLQDFPALEPLFLVPPHPTHPRPRPPPPPPLLLYLCITGALLVLCWCFPGALLPRY